MLIALPLLLLGCPDPSVPEGTPGAANTPNGPANPAPGGGEGGSTGPANPPNGGGGEGGAPSGGPGGMAALQVEPGQGVMLSGTFEYGGSVGGTLRLDLIRVTGGDHNEILHAMTLDKAGPWSIEVPKDLGKIQVSAFIDANGDGPGPGEPTGMQEVEVGSAAVSNISVKLTDTEGAATAVGGQEPPPAGGSNPGGAAVGAPPNGEPPAGGAPPAGAAPAAGGGQ